MLGYITLGTSDLKRAAAFYDALLGELGATQFMSNDRIVAWGKEAGDTMLAVCTPFDGGAPTAGNGVMVALNAESQDVVKKLHAKALQLGGSDEGEPGPRGEGGFYGGYFRDLDGNKLVAFCFAT